MNIWIPLVVGGAMLLASLHFGTQFYPPGEGYAEERRNGRISLALMIAGLAAIIPPLVLGRIT